MKLKQGLSKNCIAACDSAKLTVLSLCERFISGQVTINEYKIAGENFHLLLHLYESCSGVDRNETSEQLAALKLAEMVRREEYNIFSQYQQVLKHLCRHINSKVKGEDQKYFVQHLYLIIIALFCVFRF